MCVCVCVCVCVYVLLACNLYNYQEMICEITIFSMGYSTSMPKMQCKLHSALQNDAQKKKKKKETFSVPLIFAIFVFYTLHPFTCTKLR